MAQEILFQEHAGGRLLCPAPRPYHGRTRI